MRRFLLLALLAPSAALANGKPDPKWFACEADFDCTPAPDACGCELGGLSIAVNRAFRPAYLASRPKKACDAVKSTHWSCHSAQVRCQNKECQLVRVKPPAENASALAACEANADLVARESCITTAAARLTGYDACTRLRENRSRHACIQAVYAAGDARRVLRKDDCARVPQVTADFCPTSRDACALAAAPKDGLEACTEVSCLSAFSACASAAGLPSLGARRDAACELLKGVHLKRPTFFAPAAGGNALSAELRAYMLDCGVALPAP